MPVDRVPYVVDNALAALKDPRQLVLAGAKPPVSFFATGKAEHARACRATSRASPPSRRTSTTALDALAAELGAACDAAGP